MHANNESSFSGSPLSSGMAQPAGATPLGLPLPGAVAPQQAQQQLPHYELFSNLIGSDFMSDVTLRIGPTTSSAESNADAVNVKELRAHKVVLGAVSPMFRAMFGDAMYTESTAAEIDVPYHYETCFKAVIEYIYCGRLTIGQSKPTGGTATAQQLMGAPGGSASSSPSNLPSPPKHGNTARVERDPQGSNELDAQAVLDAACYYALDALKAAAVQELRTQTTIDNVISMLELALRYNAPLLREYCITMIRQFNLDVLDDDACWLSMSLDVALLLVQETVIGGELTILQRCYKWCKHNLLEKTNSSNNQSQIGNNKGSMSPVPPSSSDSSNSALAAPRSTNSTPPLAPNEEQLVKTTLAQFLRFIDFTAMTEKEIEIVENMNCVPLEILYKAFKSSVLRLPPTHTPRKGGIILQWEMSLDRDVDVVSNHVMKTSQDYNPKTVCAVNRFSKGKHYWTCSILDLRSPHDCLVGVTEQKKKKVPGSTSSSFLISSGGNDGEQAAGTASAEVEEETKHYLFEPCSMSVSSPPGTRVTKEPAAMKSILVDHSCVVGVMLDYNANKVQWFNHSTKELLFTAEPSAEVLFPNSDEDDENTTTIIAPSLQAAAAAASPTVGVLPAPMYPCTTLYHKSNGGVTLSECTTYLNERVSLNKHSAQAGGGNGEGGSGTPGSGRTPKKQRLGSASMHM